MARKPKTTTKIENMLLYVEETTLDEGVAEASVAHKSPAVVWTKFTLTDDMPNANRMRVPSSEFDNLVKTGLYTPIKMAEGSIADGHEGAGPLGVITNLVSNGSKIDGLAALWAEERPADVEYIKSLLDKQIPVNVSWEILYGDSSIDDEGILNLHDVKLKAATIVGIPAYKGRTQVTAIASAEKWSTAYKDSLPSENFLLITQDGNRHFPFKDDTGIVDPSRFQEILIEVASMELDDDLRATVIKQVQKIKDLVTIGAPVSEIDAERLVMFKAEANTEDTIVDKELQDALSSLDETKAQNELLASEISTLKESISAIQAEKEVLASELEDLKVFKQGVEAETEKTAKLASIKKMFTEAGIEKSEDYFISNSEHLLGLDNSSLEFMLQELVAFSASASTASAATQTPFISTTDSKKLSIKELADALNKARQ